MRPMARLPMIQVEMEMMETYERTNLDDGKIGGALSFDGVDD